MSYNRCILILQSIFVIHNIIKSQDLISFLNEYMCVWGVKNVLKTYEWGRGHLEIYESVQRGSGFKNTQI